MRTRTCRPGWDHRVLAASTGEQWDCLGKGCQSGDGRRPVRRGVRRAARRRDRAGCCSTTPPTPHSSKSCGDRAAPPSGRAPDPAREPRNGTTMHVPRPSSSTSPGVASPRPVAHRGWGGVQPTTAMAGRLSRGCPSTGPTRPLVAGVVAAAEAAGQGHPCPALPGGPVPPTGPEPPVPPVPEGDLIAGIPPDEPARGPPAPPPTDGPSGRPPVHPHRRSRTALAAVADPGTTARPSHPAGCAPVHRARRPTTSVSPRTRRCSRRCPRATSPGVRAHVPGLPPAGARQEPQRVPRPRLGRSGSPPGRGALSTGAWCSAASRCRPTAATTGRTWSPAGGLDVPLADAPAGRAGRLAGALPRPRLPGRHPLPCRAAHPSGSGPSEPYVLEPGAVLDLADGYQVVFEVTPSAAGVSERERSPHPGATPSSSTSAAAASRTSTSTSRSGRGSGWRSRSCARTSRSPSAKRRCSPPRPTRWPGSPTTPTSSR